LVVISYTQMNETTDERKKRLNRERQQRYQQKKRSTTTNEKIMEMQLEKRKNTITKESQLETIPSVPILKAPQMWLDERTANLSIKSPVFTTCCANGKVLLPPLQEPPSHLNSLLTGTESRACLFQQKIKMYNAAFTFTSMGVKIDQQMINTSGIYTFRIHGEIYHRIGTLLPDPNANPQFAQIYIYDTNNEIQNRMNIIPDLDPIILAELQQMLHQVNPYVKIFHQARDIFKNDPMIDLRMVITNNRTKDPRHYNVPSAAEVAIIMAEDGQETNPMKRDIILQSHKGGFQRISEIHNLYMPLHYVLMFPKGEDGWHPFIP
ncbi:2430_t:CDS:2, partial [Diversispora eburnea]